MTAGRGSRYFAASLRGIGTFRCIVRVQGSRYGAVDFVELSSYNSRAQQKQ
jgi:hypothetical protein